MRSLYRPAGVFIVAGLFVGTLTAQEPINTPPAQAASAVAATVNGQAIPESAVQRGLKRVPPVRQAEARADILDFLIDNALIDQYLTQGNLAVSKQEVDARYEQIVGEIKKQGGTIEKMMQELLLTEQDLRAQITADLRWDKYVGTAATDKVLHELFDKNPEMFDGTMVRARHILLTPAAGDPQAAQKAKAQILLLKQQIQQRVADEMTKLPPTMDNLTKEKARTRLLDDAFADVARKESACPSKAQGGNLDWFQRAGSMVEPFAQAAFALKPYEMSDAVTTRFGCHLILVTDRRPGKETKFEDVKDVVKEVYADRLREAVIAQLRPTAKIVVTAPANAPKP